MIRARLSLFFPFLRFFSPLMRFYLELAASAISAYIHFPSSPRCCSACKYHILPESSRTRCGHLYTLFHSSIDCQLTAHSCPPPLLSPPLSHIKYPPFLFHIVTA